MGRQTGAKKRSKTSTIQKLDLDEGRSERPTEQVYAQMVVFKSFVVADEEDTEFRFERDQVVLILPHGSNPKKHHELPTYWAARIKDIRAHVYANGVNSVWVRVQWFYSGKDVSDVVKSFDRDAVGSFERIYSDHQDFVQPEAFEMIIPMYKLNEVDHEQIYIPENSFYRRYTFEYLARNLQPKPGLTTCVCRKPYNPNDTGPKSLMHFCPRPSCRIAFHHRCLLGAKSKESSTTLKSSLTVKIPDFSDPQKTSKEGDTVKVMRSARKHVVPLKKPPSRKVKAIREAEDEAEVARAIIPTPINAPASKTRTHQSSLSPRSLRLLGCSPDTDDNLDLQALVYSGNGMDLDSDAAPVSETDRSEEEIVAPRKGKRGRPPTKKSKTKAARRPDTTLDSVLATIPPDLLTIAIQPLVRGAAFPDGGVAGNIGMVTQSRRLVYTALQMGGGQHVAPDWEDTVFGKDREVIGLGLKNAVVQVTFEGGGQAKRDQELPPFVCPNCQSAI